MENKESAEEKHDAHPNEVVESGASGATSASPKYDIIYEPYHSSVGTPVDILDMTLTHRSLTMKALSWMTPTRRTGPP